MVDCKLPAKLFARLRANDEIAGNFGDDIRALIEAQQVLNAKYNDSLNGMVDLPWAMKNADEFVSRVSGGQFRTIEAFEKDAPPAMRQTLRGAIDEQAQALARMGVDFTGEMEEFVQAERLGDVFRAELARTKGSTKLLGKIPWVFGALGEYHRALQKYEPARQLYASAKMVQNYIATGTERLAVRVNESLREFSRQTGLAPEITRKYIGYLDGQNLGNGGLDALREEFLDDDKSRRAVEEIMRSKGRDPADRDALFDGFFALLRGYQTDYWNPLNYGVKKPGEGYDALKHPDSLAGFIATSGQLLRQLLSVREGIAKAGGGDLSPAERRYLERFTPGHAAAFQIRTDNYIPSRMAPDQDAFNPLLADRPDGVLAPLSAFLERRSKTFTHKASDFIDILNQNLLSFGFAMETISSYAMAKGVQDAVEFDPDLKGQNDRLYTTLKQWSTSLVDHHERIRPRPSEAVQTTRNVMTAMHSIGALVLANPASALANYAGGLLGLYGQFGFRAFREMPQQYKEALLRDDADGEIARAVQGYADRRMTLPGRFSDYISTDRNPSVSDNIIVQVSEQAKNLSMKIADVATRQGVLPFIQRGLKLTMRSSEEWLRGNVSPVLYQMAKDRLGSLDLQSMDPAKRAEVIHDAINGSRFEAFYAMNNALLDPSKENKPFWTWQMARDAESAPMVALGGMLSMFYMFRQVAAHNLRLMGNVAGRMTEDVKNPALRGVDRYGGAGLGAGLVFMGATLAMTVYDMIAGKTRNVPRFSLLLSPNPAQEVSNAAIGALAFLGGVFNMPMSREMADGVADDFARLAGGVIAGNTLTQLVRAHEGRTDQPMSQFFSLTHALTGPLDLVSHVGRNLLHLRGDEPARDRGEYYENRREHFNNVSSAYPWFSYQNDYLNLLRKTAVATMPIGSEDTVELRDSDRMRLVLGLIGLSPSYLPSAYENSYGRAAMAAGDQVYFSTMAERQPLHTRDSTLMRIAQQQAKYGKLYPSAFWRMSR